MDNTPPALPVDLADLRAMSADIAAAEMDLLERARQSTRIAYAAIAVAFTEGLIT